MSFAEQGSGQDRAVARLGAIPDPGPALDANTSAAARINAAYTLFEPTAERTLDLTDAPQSCILRVFKDTRALFGIVLGAGGTWTTPAGAGLDYLLPNSADQLCGAWDVILDAPNKTARVVTYPRGVMEPMLAAVTASPGDTLDPSAGGTFTGGAEGSYLIGAPRSDGAAFIADAVLNTRRIQNRGLGSSGVLIEAPRTNMVLRSETIYTAGAITAPWVAIGATTGLGQQAGSPRGDATVTNLIFTASAADGIKQQLAIAAQTLFAFSVWARCTAGTEKVRLAVLLKDGTASTTADFVLTTTWQRCDIVTNTGTFGTAGTPEVRIVNGSDGAARTVQVWGAQAELGSAPSSYIKTVASPVARTTDKLTYAPGQYPASFLTRGFSVPISPEFSSLDQTLGLLNLTVASFDVDALYGPSTNSTRDAAVLFTTGGDTTASGGACRVATFAAQYYRGGGNPAQPNPYSPPVTWARFAQMTLAWEAYRGSVRIQGAASGNGRFALGGGAWSWSGGTLTILGASDTSPVGLATIGTLTAA